jgi:hypothetical protein
MKAAITPYKTAAAWGGNKFDNSKLHSLGWRQLFPTAKAMSEHFEYLRTQSIDQSVFKKATAQRVEASTTGAAVAPITPQKFARNRVNQLL